MIYYIGGSPCSGKSTVAELLCEKHGFYYYKLDDFLDDYMKLAADSGKKHCAGYYKMCPEEVWMRDPQTQSDCELAIYEEIFEYAMRDIEALAAPDIIAEGAGFLPDLMKNTGVSADRYVCVAPTPEFQLDKYSKREWISFVLAECGDPKAAFDNWMRRDMLFARHVCSRAEALGYAHIMVDGAETPEEIAARIEKIFIS